MATDRQNGRSRIVQRHAGGRPRQLPRTKLGRRIEQLATARGLHLDEVADQAGIKGPTLYRILTGRIESPKITTVLALAKVLRVPVDELLN
jgi:transcriptional regulator with XRE-family HTH domain